jgi:hypothetical protein
VFHAQRFAAQRFRVTESFFSQRGQQARLGKIKWVFGSDAKRAPGVLQRFFRLPVAQVFQALFEIVHSGI